MNNDETMKLQAGREIDDLIATQVMGWLIGDKGAHYIGNAGKNIFYVIAGDFQPSDDISAAWCVIDKLEQDDKIIEITRLSNFGTRKTLCWNVRFRHVGHNNSWNAQAETAPHAI